MKTHQLIVQGMVQGVGFRYFSKRNANILGVCGWVQNLDDGDVEIYAQADDDTLEKFRLLIEKGPFSSKVKKVIVSELDVDEKYSHFEIR